jgi:hypothetical protein
LSGRQINSQPATFNSQLLHSYFSLHLSFFASLREFLRSRCFSCKMQQLESWERSEKIFLDRSEFWTLLPLKRGAIQRGLTGRYLDFTGCLPGMHTRKKTQEFAASTGFYVVLLFLLSSECIILPALSTF